MKHALLLLIFSLLFACSEKTESKEEIKDVEQPKVEKAVAAEAPVKKSDVVVPPRPKEIPLAELPNSPCKSLSAASIATALNWKGAHDGVSKSFYDGRLQACEFTATANEGGLSASITNSDEKAIERGGLNRAYASDLNRTEGIVYELVKINLGDQSIYGFGKNGPNYHYILRWRKGNLVDYKLDYRSSKKLDDRIVLKQLIALAAELV